MRKTICVVMAALILILVSLMPCEGASGNFYWSLFIRGKLQGNMKEIKSDGTEFQRTSDNVQLVLNQPGKSKLTYVFELNEVPSQYYILNDWRSNPRRSTARININGQELSTMNLEVPRYISQGFEISSLLKKGVNTIAIELDNVSDELWVRGTILTENPSLARNVELIPELLPSYAKVFAIILLILGILYLIWFFFNRTLYKNLDVYSASFALIGIMIASIASAYSVLLVTKMMTFSIVILVLTIILAFLAMISVKRTESNFAKSVSTEGGSEEPTTTTGGDFNF